MSIFFTYIGSHIQGIFNLIYIITVVFIAVFIILENRSPLKTVSWVLVILLLPIAGIIFYMFFGQEYRKKKMFSHKGLKNIERIKEITQKQLNKLPANIGSFGHDIYEKRHLINLLMANDNAFLSDNNEVTVLKNGDECFPSIFQAIEKAKHHIHLEYYIIGDDKIGNQLRELLIRKAREGVEVRVIYDDVGTWKLSKKYIRSLKEAGVMIDCFIKVRFPLLTSKANYRNHHKIIIIDGEIGFVGGLNMADRYLYGLKNLGIWRDTHLMIKGTGTVGLQSVFAADWYFVSKELLNNKDYFHTSPKTKGKLVQIVSSGPDSDWKSISQAYLLAISSAQEKVYIATPYLIPNTEINSALKIAALSGIDIRILLPEKSDTIIPSWSTKSYIEELLYSGVKIYFYQPGFMHSKLLMVDGIFSSVGSANFDLRSMETNFEVNAMVYDKETFNTLESQYMKDLSQSREIILSEWKQRSKWEKIKESFARLLSPLL
ncbi:MAG: cardiolipin synthase [Prolixibacteraceae bacterium]|nr:cardiolipin synthase [Prolixibacteraceae bacterium]